MTEERKTQIREIEDENDVYGMWSFTKKQPLTRILKREFLGYKMEPCFGAGGMGTDVDTFAVWAVTRQDVETGKTFVKREESLV